MTTTTATLATATPHDVLRLVAAQAEANGNAAVLSKVERGTASPEDRARASTLAERALGAERLRRAAETGELPPRSVIDRYPKREQVERWPFAGDLDWSEAVGAFSGTSHVPEQRAAGTFWDYAAHMQKMKELLGDDFEAYRAGYLPRFRAWLRSRANVVSTMIAGGSGFNVRRAEKRSATADNRWNDVDDYHTAFLKRRAREQVAARRAAAGGVVGELRAEIERLERLQEAMKAVNAEIRKLKAMPTTPADINTVAALIEARTGMAAADVAKALVPDFAGRVGFPSYALTNNNANIKRKQERLAEEEAKAARAADTGEDFTREVAVNGGVVSVRYNREEDRLQLAFPRNLVDGEALRGAALKWSPTRGVWQRQLTDNAVYYVNMMLRKAGATERLPTLAQSLAARAPVTPAAAGAELTAEDEAAADADAAALVAQAALVEPGAGEEEAEAEAEPGTPAAPAPRPADLRVVDYMDFFKLREAPYVLEERVGESGRSYTVKVYLPEAYTADYMIPSDETGRLVRWGVKLNDGRVVSRDGIFRLRFPEAWERVKARAARARGEARDKLLGEALWGLLTPEEQRAMIASVNVQDFADGRGAKQALADLEDFLRREGSLLAYADHEWWRDIANAYAVRMLGGPVGSDAWRSAPFEAFAAYKREKAGKPVLDSNPATMPLTVKHGQNLSIHPALTDLEYWSSPGDDHPMRAADKARVFPVLLRRFGSALVRLTQALAADGQAAELPSEHTVSGRQARDALYHEILRTIDPAWARELGPSPSMLEPVVDAASRVFRGVPSTAWGPVPTGRAGLAAEPAGAGAIVAAELDPTEYRYGLVNRPVGLGNTPPGDVRVEPPVPDYPTMTRHGVVVYRRPLTDDEVRSYELARYLPAGRVEEELYAKFRSVVANEAEERSIIEDMREDRAWARQGILYYAEALGRFFSNAAPNDIADRVIDRLIGGMAPASAPVNRAIVAAEAGPPEPALRPSHIASLQYINGKPRGVAIDTIGREYVEALRGAGLVTVRGDKAYATDAGAAYGGASKREREDSEMVARQSLGMSPGRGSRHR